MTDEERQESRRADNPPNALLTERRSRPTARPPDSQRNSALDLARIGGAWCASDCALHHSSNVRSHFPISWRMRV